MICFLLSGTVLSVVAAALRRQRALRSLTIWRDKPAATSARMAFCAAYQAPAWSSYPQSPLPSDATPLVRDDIVPRCVDVLQGSGRKRARLGCWRQNRARPRRQDEAPRGLRLPPGSQWVRVAALRGGRCCKGNRAWRSVWVIGPIGRFWSCAAYSTVGSHCKGTPSSRRLSKTPATCGR